jgi:low temperature requirement protein LtrA
MTTSRAAELLRSPEDPQRATFLELFFDLVFVLALTQLSHGLIQHLTWTGAGQTLLLLLALWWVWAQTAGLTDRLDPQRPPIQLTVIATMLGTLVLAAAAPEAFGKQGPLFAGAYVVVNIGRSAFLVLVLRGHEVRRLWARQLVWFVVSAVPWITGAVVHGWARAALWTLALSVDYALATLLWPTPGLGWAKAAEIGIASEHLAERSRQFFIIALGELILLSGLAYGASGFHRDSNAALLVSFTTTVLLWRIYIYRAGELLGTAIAAARDPIRVGFATNYAHLTMVAGIVLTAVGDEILIAHPAGHTRPAWTVVLLGGPALFLVGRAMFECGVFARVSRNRWIGLLVLAALTPVMLHSSPIVVGLAAAAVLTGIAVSDTARSRRRPAETPSPLGGPSPAPNGEGKPA